MALLIPLTTSLLTVVTGVKVVYAHYQLNTLDSRVSDVNDVLIDTYANIDACNKIRYPKLMTTSPTMAPEAINTPLANEEDFDLTPQPITPLNNEEEDIISEINPTQLSQSVAMSGEEKLTKLTKILEKLQQVQTCISSFD
jgi:hypothetical protein